MVKKVRRKPVRLSEEDTFLVQIPEMTDEQYERLVSVIRDRFPEAVIYGLQKEYLYDVE